jgi:hypothetical protein
MILEVEYTGWVLISGVLNDENDGLIIVPSKQGGLELGHSENTHCRATVAMIKLTRKGRGHTGVTLATTTT